jgi:hypothetical protein
MAACTDLERTNPVDPKNEKSMTESVVLIEAFVNTFNDTLYNQWMLSALNEIDQLYNDRILIAEYHRNVSDPKFDDPHSDIRYEELYNTYLSAFSGSVKGVPDVFIQGINGRVQGASATDDARDRVAAIVNPILETVNEYYIEGEVNQTSSGLEVLVRAARLGNKALGDARLRFIFLRAADQNLLRNVVVGPVDWISPIVIQDLAAGDYFEHSEEQIEFSAAPDRLIIALTSADGKYVYQSLEVRL